MWELDYKEGWAPKNWCFWTGCWRRLLRVPCTTRKSNQYILKEISPGCSLKRLMLKLKLRYFGYLMRRADSLERTLMLGEIEGSWKRGRKGWDGWMASPPQWTLICVDSGIDDGLDGLACCGSWITVLDMTEQLNWTELMACGIETSVNKSVWQHYVDRD